MYDNSMKLSSFVVVLFLYHITVLVNVFLVVDNRLIHFKLKEFGNVYYVTQVSDLVMKKKS